MATSIKLSLWAYAATGGSLAVALGALASLPIPNPWSIPVWVVVSAVLCTGAGLLAPRFVRLEGDDA